MSGETIPMTNRESNGGQIVRESAGAGVILTATYVPGTILNCAGYRKVRFWLALDGDASSTGSALTALVLISPGTPNVEDAPAAAAA